MVQAKTRKKPLLPKRRQSLPKSLKSSQNNSNRPWKKSNVDRLSWSGNVKRKKRVVVRSWNVIST